MDIKIDLKNYKEGLEVFKRTASRGIIKRGDKYLLIFSKYGDYKFPGGGREEGESLEENLIREVKEENGFNVIESSIKYYGKALERRKGEEDSIMEMDSHYFICDVDSQGERNLDDYEKEYDYKVIWTTLDEAIKKNKMDIDLEKCPWVIRDTKVMEILNQK